MLGLIEIKSSSLLYLHFNDAVTTSFDSNWSIRMCASSLSYDSEQNTNGSKKLQCVVC